MLIWKDAAKLPVVTKIRLLRGWLRKFSSHGSCRYCYVCFSNLSVNVLVSDLLGKFGQWEVPFLFFFNVVQVNLLGLVVQKYNSFANSTRRADAHVASFQRHVHAAFKQCIGVKPRYHFFQMHTCVCIENTLRGHLPLLIPRTARLREWSRTMRVPEGWTKNKQVSNFWSFLLTG